VPHPLSLAQFHSGTNRQSKSAVANIRQTLRFAQRFQPPVGFHQLSHADFEHSLKRETVQDIYRLLVPETLKSLHVCLKELLASV
jgi:hypothetical protein